MHRRSLDASRPAIPASPEATPEDVCPGAGSAPQPVAFTIAIRVKPGHEAEFLELLTPILDAMRHESSFINAILHRDPEDPARFLIYETWTDLDDVMEVKLQCPYRAAYLHHLPEILAEERVIGVWRPMRADFARSA